MTLRPVPVRAPSLLSTDSRELGPSSPADPHRSAARHMCDAELRRAYLAAKNLAEALEVADLRFLHRIAVAVREEIFLELVALNDERQVGDPS